MHISASYESPISGDRSILDLVVDDNDRTRWVYRDAPMAQLNSQPYTRDYTESLNWFAKVYADLKPQYKMEP